MIAEVGAWRNMLDPGRAETGRQSALCYRAAGAGGSGRGAVLCRHRRLLQPHGLVRRRIRRISRGSFSTRPSRIAARSSTRSSRRATTFSIEMMGWSLPDGPDTYLKLIRRSTGPAFAVHMDVCNGINSPDALLSQRASSSRSASRNSGSGSFPATRRTSRGFRSTTSTSGRSFPASGKLTTRRICASSSKLPVDAPLMLEHLQTADEYSEGRNHIRSVGDRIGIRFA